MREMLALQCGAFELPRALSAASRACESHLTSAPFLVQLERSDLACTMEDSS